MLQAANETPQEQGGILFTAALMGEAVPVVGDDVDSDAAFQLVAARAFADDGQLVADDL